MVDKYFTENYNMLKRYAITFSSKHYEDILHNTYIEAKKSELKIREKNKVGAYIKTIIRRQAYKNYELDSKELLIDGIEIEYHNDYTNLLKEEILESLNSKDRELALLLNEGFTQKDISKILEEDYERVKKRTQRLRKKITK